MEAGTTLITGGTRGIGRAIVEALATEKRTVAFTWCSNEDLAREVERSTTGRATAFHMDIRDRSRPRSLVEEVESRLGPIEALVNNAATQHIELLAMTSDQVWDDVIDVNLGGAFRLSREVIRGMTTRRRGSIVNVSSLSALHGVAGHGAYAASKAGLLALTRCLAREMGRREIRVNAVVAGFVPTDMTSSLPESAVARLRSTECLPSGTEPMSVADAVQFLLSDKAASITGQTLVVDAGTTA
jgi:3-oxoacyl-[acyl-carrier protein] reductase